VESFSEELYIFARGYTNFCTGLELELISMDWHWCQVDGGQLPSANNAVVSPITYGCMLHKAMIFLPCVIKIKIIFFLLNPTINGKNDTVP